MATLDRDKISTNHTVAPFELLVMYSEKRPLRRLVAGSASLICCIIYEMNIVENMMLAEVSLELILQSKILKIKNNCLYISTVGLPQAISTDQNC